MFRCLYFVLIIELFFLSTSYSAKSENLLYNLTKPDITLLLPDTLNEISGIAIIDDSIVACIQDEKGIIFIYDIAGNKLIKQFEFQIDGDYEGIALVDKTIYILRSDGTLLEIINYKSKDCGINLYSTGIPANNNEGLCYDEDNNRLLIGCKSNLGKGPDFRNKRAIFSFDLKTKRLSDKPLIEFDLKYINDFANLKNIEFPQKTNKKGRKIKQNIKFRISAICIHPITKKLFLLSAIDYLLFMFDLNGNIEHIEKLNPVIFNKAEGISFIKNGDMLITNEGQNKKPTLLRFDYLK
ncbi:MAG: hypothetical protein HZB41_00295 [Ignavibacteriae bacterium]|nr:hypothetical protein [Ignavibacteriota bacterium]